MLKKRIIPCLDIKDGYTVKGINFTQLKLAGNPVDLAKFYVDEGADELVFLDITATIEKRKTFLKLVEKIAKQINIPFTVGGGISSLNEAKMVINAGAEKISLNSAAVKNPELITVIANELGSQCVVVAIDTKLLHSQWWVFINGGTRATDLLALNWAKNVEQLGAGEILLTSMDNDGTKNGFDLNITAQITKAINIPLIASGGAGSCSHFKDIFTKTEASAALAASIFHYNEISIPQLKKYLHLQNIQVRWN